MPFFENRKNPASKHPSPSIMVNCNPETVSTDYDTSDKLYLEPLTIEDVLSIYEKDVPVLSIGLRTKRSKLSIPFLFLTDA
jgi:hypothetical protein